MEISTEIGSFRRYGTNREILRLLKDSGFTAYDFSMFRGTLKDRLIDSENYREDAKALREYADSIGLRCNQAHAPFPTARKGNESYNESAFPEIARAIEVSGILGAKVWRGTSLQRLYGGGKRLPLSSVRAVRPPCRREDRRGKYVELGR